MEDSGAEPQTTNNRMELMAVIRGLERLQRPTSVLLYADSQYVGKGLTEWMPKWKANGWKRGTGRDAKPPMNIELWRRLDELLQTHQVFFEHVYGHSGHTENERCDELAVAAYQRLMGRR